MSMWEPRSPPCAKLRLVSGSESLAFEGRAGASERLRNFTGVASLCSARTRRSMAREIEPEVGSPGQEAYQVGALRRG